MKTPRLPRLEPTGIILYSTWREGGVLPEEAARRQRVEADKGHALAITVHSGSTSHNDSYTEAMSCLGAESGKRIHGVRTVTPAGEELVQYNTPGEARTRYRETLEVSV